MTDAAPASGGAVALVSLLTLLSPGFPIGAFAYSHGLEAAIAEGRVADGETLFQWTRSLLRHGSAWNDLVLFAAAHRAVLHGDADALSETRELGLALGGSRERREETRALGAAFAEASSPWDVEGASDRAAPYPVAVAALVARRGIAIEDGLAAFAHGFAANLVAAATRLVPLGQSEAVKLLARLEPELVAVARRAARTTLDDLGSATILSDISAMRHETLSTRLFRT